MKLFILAYFFIGISVFLFPTNSASAQDTSISEPGWRVTSSDDNAEPSFTVGNPKPVTSPGRFKIAEKSSLEVGMPKFTTGSPMALSAEDAEADFQTEDIIALAAGLKNDRDLIFQWVQKNIRYAHYHGCNKGAQLTYLERSGNDIDQSALLVALWRAAGIECRYVSGVIEMPKTTANNLDWKHYLGVEASEVEGFVSVRQTPGGSFGYRDAAQPNLFFLKRVWVQANVAGTWRDYDPSLKLIEPVTGIDLAVAMSYNRANLLTSLGAGTAGANSITGLSYANLATHLATRTNDLLTDLRANHLNKSVVEIVGGWRPLAHSSIEGHGFPVFDAGYYSAVYTTWDVLPDDRYATLKLEAPSVGLTWGPEKIANLRGQRLALHFVGGKATLVLDGTQLAQATSATATTTAITATFDHPDSTITDQTGTMIFTLNGIYALPYGFDVSPEYVKSRQRKLLSYEEQGVPSTALAVRLESLNVIGLQWYLQTGLAGSLVADRKNFSTTFFHRFGRSAEEPSGSNTFVYVDMPMNFIGFDTRIAGNNAKDTSIMVWSFLASAMEHGVLEQTQPLTSSGAVTNALSTAKIIKVANDTNIPVFLANSSNYGVVRPEFTAPPATAYDSLTLIDDTIANSGEVLAPKSAKITVNSWTGRGYSVSRANSWGMIIGGGLNGGHTSQSTQIQTQPLIIQASFDPDFKNTQTIVLPAVTGGDPINMATGAFLYERELLTAGQGLVRGLNFGVSYDGDQRLENSAKLGYGWTHGYYVRIGERADIEGAFGASTAVEMASTLVGTISALDVFTNRAGVKDWVAMALIANWTVNQLKESGVSVVSGNQIWQFHRQPNGSYSSPAGATQTLVKNGSGNYEMTERNGPTWRFDANKRLWEIRDLWNKALTLTYNGNGDLATVTDAYARTLTFAYTGTGAAAALSTVTDNGSPARSVSFTLDAAKDLTALTDPEGKADNFEYDTGHLLATHKNHDNQVIVTNGYDGLGRVITQDTMGDINKRWKFYYSPGQTIEEEPAISGFPAALTYHYFDARNREVELVNALGHRLLTTYDSQNRVRKKERKIGTTVSDVTTYEYDANHNLLEEKDPQLKTVVYAYDGSNRLESVKDKRGNYSYFQIYNGQNQPTQTTDRENRVVTYTYKPSGDPSAGSVATVAEGGFTTTYGYDARGALSSIAYPGGASESLINNFLGDPTSRTDEIGRATTIGYNRRREAVSTTIPGTPSSGTRTTTMGYDNQRNLVNTQNPRGFDLVRFYSPTQKLTLLAPTGGGNLYYLYDNRDHMEWSSDEMLQWTHYERDGLGRETAEGDPIGRTTATTFDDANRRMTVQSPSPLNYQNSVTFDSRDQVVRDQDALTNYATPHYDDNGNQDTWKDRRGKTWTFTYDNEDRLENATSPLSRTTGQIWDGRGLLWKITEPSTQLTTLGYDGRRRLTSRADAVGTVIYELDDASQLKKVTQGSAILERTYHASGEVATYKNANNETIGYDYDRNGNLVSLTYPAIGSVPAATVTYTYDNRDRMTSMTDWAGRTTTYTWDAANRLTLVTRPNGTKRRLSWDTVGQLRGIEERPASGAPFAIRTFSYDAVGRVNKRLAFPQATTWAEPAWTAGYDNDNRQTSLAGATLSYDADGNLQGSKLPDGPWGSTGSSVGQSGTYAWNARNQLTGVTRTGGQTAGYTYDAEGNLIQTVDSVGGTTRWVIDPNGGQAPRVLAKVAPGGAVTRYVYGIGLGYEVKSDGSTRHYHYDQVGSTIATTDGTGAVVGRADYTPYGGLQSVSGELANANATPFLFVGAHGVMTDAVTGLHQMRARWYSSYTRRFLSEDPAGFAGGENFYAYAAGNPVNMIDPLGLRPVAGSGNGSSLLNGLQTGLDVVSLAPGVGSFASGANALIHLVRGNYVDAGLSAAGIIPGVAIVVKGAKIATAAGIGIKLGRGAASGAIKLPQVIKATQWGWKGTPAWNSAVKEIASGGVIRSVAGKTPTYDEAIALIKQAGGRVDRVDGSHAGSLVAGQIDFPHINYTTASGTKAHLAIDSAP